MSAEDENTILQTILDRVTDSAGEHCKSFVFIGTVEHPDESMQTISTWRGDFNAVVGLTERLKERMRQKIIETDFPDDPQGEDWKEAT